MFPGDWKIRLASVGWDFPGGSVVKNLPANAGDAGSTPGSCRDLGGGNGNPLQCSCLGNPMDRGVWQATHSPWGHTESDTTELVLLLLLSPLWKMPWRKKWQPAPVFLPGKSRGQRSLVGCIP